MDHRRSVPQNGNIIPCVGCRYDRYVDEARSGRMSKVERGQVKEVDDEHQFSQPEPTADPEHDMAKDEEIILTALLVCFVEQITNRDIPR